MMLASVFWRRSAHSKFFWCAAENLPKATQADFLLVIRSGLSASGSPAIISRKRPPSASQLTR